MFETICTVCGRKFNAKIGTSKYCSDACRAEGRRRTRADWKDRTNYNQRHREAMALYRANTTAEVERERKKKEAAHKRYLKAKARKAREAAEKELIDRASSGDNMAQMDIAQQNGDDAAYWEAFKNYELQTAEEIGYKGELMRVVNNIPIDDPDFVSNVIESIEQEGHISTALIRL